ncbi:MAG: hypothetical protein F4X62_05945, partial [Caldilineaceae bacterium SB0662_bin_25]|nr:hypothetical protein [Caldilineaceae bacterium SB0662_bin_25]
MRMRTKLPIISLVGAGALLLTLLAVIIAPRPQTAHAQSPSVTIEWSTYNGNMTQGDQLFAQFTFNNAKRLPCDEYSTGPPCYFKANISPGGSSCASWHNRIRSFWRGTGDTKVIRYDHNQVSPNCPLGSHTLTVTLYEDDRSTTVGSPGSNSFTVVEGDPTATPTNTARPRPTATRRPPQQQQPPQQLPTATPTATPTSDTQGPLHPPQDDDNPTATPTATPTIDPNAPTATPTATPTIDPDAPTATPTATATPTEEVNGDNGDNQGNGGNQGNQQNNQPGNQGNNNQGRSNNQGGNNQGGNKQGGGVNVQSFISNPTPLPSYSPQQYQAPLAITVPEIMNVRSGPGLTYDIVTTVPAGTQG